MHLKTAEVKTPLLKTKKKKKEDKKGELTNVKKGFLKEEICKVHP